MRLSATTRHLASISFDRLPQLARVNIVPKQSERTARLSFQSGTVLGVGNRNRTLNQGRPAGVSRDFVRQVISLRYPDKDSTSEALPTGPVRIRPPVVKLLLIQELEKAVKNAARETR